MGNNSRLVVAEDPLMNPNNNRVGQNAKGNKQQKKFKITSQPNEQESNIERQVKQQEPKENQAKPIKPGNSQVKA